jgi:hypothetical protein
VNIEYLREVVPKSFDRLINNHNAINNAFGFHPSTVTLSPHVALDDHFAESLSFHTELSATPDVTSDLNTALKLFERKIS